MALLGYLGLNASASRLLGPDLYGRFVIVITLTTALGQLGVFGVQGAGLRDTARLRESDDPQALAEQRRIVRAVTWLILPAVGLMSAAGYAIAVRPEPGAAGWVAPACVGALVVLGGHQKLVANYLRGFGHLRLASVLEGRSGGALVAVLQGGLLLAILVLAPGLGFAGALGAVALGYAAPLVPGWRSLARRWRQAPVRLRPIADVRLVFARGRWFASIRAAEILEGHLELWMAGALLVSLDASLFAAAQRLVLLLAVPLMVLQVVLSPAISRLYGSGDLLTLEHLLRTGAVITGIGTVLLSLPIFFAPGPILRAVFGDGFGAAAPILVLLSVGYMAKAAAGLCTAALAMCHSESMIARIQWIGVVVRLAIGATALVLWGPSGLAVSASLVTGAVIVALWWQARCQLSTSTHATSHPHFGLLLRMSG